MKKAPRFRRAHSSLATTATASRHDPALLVWAVDQVGDYGRLRKTSSCWLPYRAAGVKHSFRESQETNHYNSACAAASRAIGTRYGEQDT